MCRTGMSNVLKGKSHRSLPQLYSPASHRAMVGSVSTSTYSSLLGKDSERLWDNFHSAQRLAGTDADPSERKLA